MTFKCLAAAIENPDFAATWAREDGPVDVLIQVFERRVLIYTPVNDPAW